MTEDRGFHLNERLFNNIINNYRGQMGTTENNVDKTRAGL